MFKINNLLKRFFDIVFSIIGIIILIPFFIIIFLAIRIDSKGPVFFKQARLGKNGLVFQIYKFRSMVVNAEFIGTGLFNFANDPRVTRVGGFMRKTSIDELPQLLNILKGDMSFVGPRPPVTYELGDYKDFDSTLKKCYTVKPGVTGLAQINGRNELSRDEKIKYDFQYVESYHKWGLLLDLKIMLITIFKVITMEGSSELTENMESDSAKIKTPKP